MTELRSCFYAGTVVHKRLRPKRHAFSYRVFSLALDVDEIDAIAVRLRLFSHNRWNVLSFHDRDHGCGDGTPLAMHIRRLLGWSGLEACADRVTLLCYPRLFGFVFNPLSVYFCWGADGVLGAIVYEVSNTFGERKSYVIPAVAGSSGALMQSCAKELYVSPFTSAAGAYSFHVLPPAERVVVGVDLRDPDGALLKTHFSGERMPLDDRTIAALVTRHPLMTMKVVAGIHFEAARLWLKGVPLVPRHVSPKFSYTVVDPKIREESHA